MSGRVLRADGSPVAFASMRLFYPCTAGDEITWIGISSKNAGADGRYAWDYVLSAPRIMAVDPESDPEHAEFRDVEFRIARDGQRMNVDLVLLGRGTFQGRTLDERR